LTEVIQNIAYWIAELGAWGYPLAVLLMAGVAVLPIPAEIPAMMNGVLFGPVAGVIVTWTGAIIGAVVSFELSRRFGRPLVEKVISAGAIVKIDKVVSKASWPGLLIVRFIPAIAFTALNWGIGLTACSRQRFIWTTAVGILPGTILFVASGEGVARLYRNHPTAATIVSAVALAVIVLLAVRNHRAEAASEAHG
jgi:uncharacterized membrane protein YdjX (TVP38/TMEM64 family)